MKILIVESGFVRISLLGSLREGDKIVTSIEALLQEDLQAYGLVLIHFSDVSSRYTPDYANWKVFLKKLEAKKPESVKCMLYSQAYWSTPPSIFEERIVTFDEINRLYLDLKDGRLDENEFLQHLGIN